MDTSSERRIEQERVVTGEAVALDITPASLSLRLISGAIDYGIMVCGAVLSLLTLAMVAPTNLSLATVTTGISLVLFIWMVALPVSVETLSRGLSAGRLVTGTRVVRDDGGAVRLRHSLVRALTGVVEVLLTSGGLAVCSCIVTKRGKRLGDLLAGTYVVNERSKAGHAPPLVMPPELAQWAEHTDLRSLPGNLALVGRTFLQRASTLDPQSRTRIGLDLAGQVMPCVAPPPPPGTHPERFLAAVLVERRERELALAVRDLHADQRMRQEDAARLARAAQAPSAS